MARNTPKPVILCVDDDASVLDAVYRDLRAHYRADYSIAKAPSAAQALEALQGYAQRQQPVALLVVDQRMPDMNGVELLVQARQQGLADRAKRVLLTAYADTDAAIDAINTAGVNHYLLKPWDPPEDKLYPVLDGLLRDWRVGYHPPFTGARVVGHRWSPLAYQLKDFLSRNLVPYRSLDVEADAAEAHKLMHAHSVDDDALPLVVLEDGQVLRAPSVSDLANELHLPTTAQKPFYDLAIIGGGPAGLAAAVYGASEGLSTVMIEREAPGGQAGTSSKIENYLGFPEGLSGGELAKRSVDQARRFNVEILAPQEVTTLTTEGPYRILTLVNGEQVRCHAVVISVGLSYRRLDVPGAQALEGAGIYYGASLTEASACADQTVFVVGAGNSAGQAAIYLARYAAQVKMLVRGDDLGAKMSHYLVRRIQDAPNIEVCLQCEVAEVHGAGRLEAVTVRHTDGTLAREDGTSLFVFIGATPRTDWLVGTLALDDHGFLLTGEHAFNGGPRPPSWDVARAPYLLETCVPGVFAVGDVRAESVKRVASAVGEGAIAVQFVHQHLAHVK